MSCTIPVDALHFPDHAKCLTAAADICEAMKPGKAEKGRERKAFAWLAVFVQRCEVCKSIKSNIKIQMD